MRESVIFEIKSLYRDDFRIKAYTFGRGEKSLCVVGNSRGNEYQQIFICSQLVRRLKMLEKEKKIIKGREIMVIPSVNPSSMNIGKRFWAIDNTDINRMYPGYALGETTQRIAAGVFEVVNKYQNGVQLTSFYMPGDFSPHVRVMHTGYENLDKADDFGLPYVVVRDPRPYDTTTLNYNWQIWETDAYSLYSTTTNRIDVESANMIVDGIIRFMIKNGMVMGEVSEVKPSIHFNSSCLISLRPQCSGLFTGLVDAQSRVHKGDVCACIYDPCDGEILEKLIAPCDGVVFFQHKEPLVYAYTAAIKILPDSIEDHQIDAEAMLKRDMME